MAVINTGIPVQNLSIVKSGVFSFVKPINTSSYIESIEHGLSYTPLFFAYDLTNGYARPIPSLVVEDTGSNSGKTALQITVTSDGTDLVCRVTAPNYASNTYYSGTVTVLVTYDLLSELITE